MNRLPRRARVLAAALGLAMLLIVAWQLATPRDPILGTWRLFYRGTVSAPEVIQFHADGTYHTELGQTGAWSPTTGPLYLRAPGSITLQEIIANDYHVLTNYVTESQLEPEHFQRALQQRAIVRVPENYPVRLYDLRSNNGRDSDCVTLENQKLIIHGLRESDDYQRPGTWLTRAWQRLRDALHF